ncbi:MAG: Hpt domain-containing protein [Planctomycetes bacterium]|nr:Hpt domain-containing protein [Planctomycetota bacterium]
MRDGEPPLISDYANDPEMVELVAMFVAEFPERIRALREAFAKRDLRELASLAHQLQGAAGGYGFMTITEQAALVEQESKRRVFDRAFKEAFDELVALCARACPTEQS